MNLLIELNLLINKDLWNSDCCKKLETVGHHAITMVWWFFKDYTTILSWLSQDVCIGKFRLKSIKNLKRYLRRPNEFKQSFVWWTLPTKKNLKHGMCSEANSVENKNQCEAIVTKKMSSKHFKSVIVIGMKTFLWPITNHKKTTTNQEAVLHWVIILSIPNIFLEIIGWQI